MSYVTAYTEMVVGQKSKVPNVIEYRIGVLYAPINSAVIQIVSISSSVALLLADNDLRDEILNKIALAELAGLPLQMLRVLIGGVRSATEFAIAVDVNDYLSRPNPRKSVAEPDSRMKKRETIQIETRDAYIGRTRFVSRPLPQASADLLELFAE